MFWRREAAQRVIGICPETGASVSTHAWMTPKALRKFDRTLALFCQRCRKAHVFDREHLELEDSPAG